MTRIVEYGKIHSLIEGLCNEVDAVSWLLNSDTINENPRIQEEAEDKMQWVFIMLFKTITNELFMIFHDRGNIHFLLKELSVNERAAIKKSLRPFKDIITAVKVNRNTYSAHRNPDGPGWRAGLDIIKLARLPRLLKEIDNRYLEPIFSRVN